MQIAFGKLLAFDFFSLVGRACLFARGSFYLSLNEKVFLFPVQVLYFEIFKMVIPRICWLYGINLFTIL